jgi:hypothetical protein
MIILQDTREKDPWSFDFYSDVEEVRVQGLKTGDYSLWGYDSIISIERKKSSGEIALNLGQKWKAFSNELNRMQSFSSRYIICEFPESDLDIFPENSGIPKNQWSKLRINSSFLKHRLYDAVSQSNIELIFCNSKSEAEDRAYNILKDFIKEYE